MSLPLPAKRFSFASDLQQVPEHLVGEIVGGELYTSPRPAAAHTRAASRLGGALDGPFDRGNGGPGGWIILDEPELHLGSNILVPDLAGWRRSTMPTLPHVAHFNLAPDWICEILSPATEIHLVERHDGNAMAEITPYDAVLLDPSALWAR